MRVEIEVPRPFATLTLLLAIGGFVMWFNWIITPDAQVAASVAGTEVVEHPSVHGGSSLPPDQDALAALVMQRLDEVGGDTTDPRMQIHDAEESIRSARSTQQLLEQKEMLVKYELTKLQEAREALGPVVDASVEEEFRQAAMELSRILMDQKEMEKHLLSAFNQLWAAQGEATAWSRGLTGEVFRGFTQDPVDMSVGLSAYFMDAAYKKLLGVEHKGIDIRVPKGTIIYAPADGIVRKVVNKDWTGFNYVTIEVEGAVVMLGHISDAYVKEGDRVFAGDPIAASGGRPGDKGAGFSTGEHLHMELSIDGVQVDPLPYLPGYSDLE
jgi:murein DD-endopeptidase MepM/ murein hydrolase activator NlpD